MHKFSLVFILFLLPSISNAQIPTIADASKAIAKGNAAVKTNDFQSACKYQKEALEIIKLNRATLEENGVYQNVLKSQLDLTHKTCAYVSKR